MKRVCLIFNHFQHQDGVARSALAIANKLVQLNIAEVTLIPIYRDEKEFHSLLNPNVKVRHVFGFFFRGLPHIVDKLPLSLINKRLFTDKYDIVVGFQYGLSIRCVAAIPHRSHVSMFAWMHCYDEGLTLRKEYEIIGKVVCVSRCNSERLYKELPTIQVDYNYNPIEQQFVQECGSKKIDIDYPTHCPLFVTVGRMSPEKGYDRLLNVCKRLKDEGHLFILWLIGEGPVYLQLQQQMRDMKLEDCVRFLGQQSNPYKYIAKADVFVCSSFVEGYSTACTEAIMLGVPIITTNVSGAEEIIEDAECGKMVGMDDESLYKGLREVLQNPSVINDWKDKLKNTRERFYAETRIKKLISILGLNEE